MFPSGKKDKIINAARCIGAEGLEFVNMDKERHALVRRERAACT
jgi:hypothetical protein